MFNIIHAIVLKDSIANLYINKYTKILYENGLHKILKIPSEIPFDLFEGLRGVGMVDLLFKEKE